MSDHNHSSGCCHSHSEEVDTNNTGFLYSLYSKIDLEKLQCLNEVVENSGKTVFRSYDDRLSKEFVGF